MYACVYNSGLYYDTEHVITRRHIGFGLPRICVHIFRRKDAGVKSSKADIRFFMNIIKMRKYNMNNAPVTYTCDGPLQDIDIMYMG